MRAAIVLAVVLVLSGLLTALSLRTPEPLPASSASDQFSAMRARADLDWLAAQAHPTGSPALQQVRIDLTRRLTSLGLQVSTQPALAVNAGRPGSAVAARLENVIGVLPGVDRSAPALLLMAHIDSVSNSAGAADDGIGVVSMIEIARALAAGPAAQRDVIFLFTDGEEIGLLGAVAFFDQNPLAMHVGMLLNLEARGSSGRVSMFQTGGDNAALIDLYGRVAKGPEASSLTSFAYRHMPNDTDFTIALKHRLPGLNFAIVGDQFDYHSASATPANLDLGSLQQMGEQALAISRELATSTDLPSASQDAVYSDLFGYWLIHYPAWVGWLLLVASSILLLLAARRLRWRFGDLLREVGLCVYVLITSALALRLGYRLLGGVANPGLSEGRKILAGFAQFDLGAGLVATAIVVLACAAMLRGSGRIALALFALVVGIACSMGGLDLPAVIAAVIAALVAITIFGRRRGTPGVGLGIAVLVLLLGIAMQAMAPELTPILLWPLLAGSVTLALLGRRGSTSIVAAIAVGGIAFLAKFADGVMVGLGFGMPEAAALPTMLSVLLVYPLLVATMHPLALGERRGKRALGSFAPSVFAGLIAIAGMAMWLLVALRPTGDARKPAISQVMHVSDADSRQDHRVSALDPLDDWSRAALTATGAEVERGSLPAAFINTTWQASTPTVSAAPLSLVVDAGEGGRHVLTITPPANARELRLQLRATVVASDVQLEGHAVALLDEAGQWNRLRLFPNGEPIRLSWHADGAGTLDVAHAAISDGWPADATPLPERPPDVMPWGSSDTHIVIGTSKLQW